MAMPQFQLFNASTAGGTAVMLDWAAAPFSVSYALELLAGTGTFGVQYTLDTVNTASGTAVPLASFPGQTTTVTWFNDAFTGTTATTSLSGSYTFPVQALRVVISTAFANSTGSFSLQFVVLQGFPVR